ncbi:MAG: hypothetical protein PHC66_01220 [Candidatus Nanoarchaeia archaeon]|nr:hypothetical protein [Candidatus Nanoarchaeia archaeon]MDD5239114.1 hypothetical protein [Candidatus Nanoarchaeia archaeon]
MEMPKKYIVIGLITGLVIILSAYFIFAPNQPKVVLDNSTESQIMADAVNNFNTKYNIYLESYSNTSTYGNSMGADSQITSEELISYEALLREFINDSDNMIESCDNVRTLIIQYSYRFQNVTETKAQFDDTEGLVDNDLNNIVMFINVLRSQIGSLNAEHDKALNDLSVELIEIRER